MPLFDRQAPLDLIPVGRIAVDFNPTDYYQPLSTSANFNKYLGGSPANIAVGMARLDKKVGFIGKVSNDAFGDFATEFFLKEGIDISAVARAKNGEKIGLTFTEMLSPTQSSILMYREGAADLALTTDDVSAEYVASARAVLISGTSLSGSPSREAALKVLALAKAAGLTVIFDADYRPYTWKNDDEIAIYLGLVAERSDMILGSREEFDRMERLLNVDGTDASSAQHWLSRGASVVIIKHGKDGSRAFAASGESYFVKPYPVTMLKGFGGGDGYASALLSGLLSGNTLRESLAMGSASAAMLVASHACSADMPGKAALKAFMAAHPGEIVQAL